MKPLNYFALLPLLLLASCALLPTEPIEPHYVQAERLTFDAVKPAAMNYVLADTSLDLDTRQDRFSQLKTWETSIVDGEVNPDVVMKTDHLRAERAAFDKITPWYLAYLTDDPDLTESQKATKADTVLSWDFRLKRAERAAGLRGPPDE